MAEPKQDPDEPVYVSFAEAEVEDYDPARDGDDSIPPEQREQSPSETPARADGRRKPKIVPFRREVRLGARGRDVIAIKRALSTAGFLRWTSKWSPVFDAGTRNALRRFQRKHGLEVDGVYGPNTHKALARYFDDYALHHLWTAKADEKDDAKRRRHAIVAAAYLAYRNAGRIHYTQSGSRMQGVRDRIRPPRVPAWEDCSSISTWYYWVARASDPNGRGYDGYGYTGTLSRQGRPTPNPKPGDLGFYGGAWPYGHVVVFVGGGKCVSHGSEGGPYLLDYRYRADFNHWRTYL